MKGIIDAARIFYSGTHRVEMPIPNNGDAGETGECCPIIAIFD
jgi:hypothetical protein